MKLISHRGNINGPTSRENHPDYISEALELGYDVEVDVWYISGKLYLGHDRADYEIDISFLNDNRIWCHCKNIEALKLLVENNIHCFFHNNDDVTLTSKGFLWTYPERQLTERSICVLPEIGFHKGIEKCYAICSDFVGDLKNEENFSLRRRWLYRRRHDEETEE
jgi:hypothetical protein